MKWLMDKMLLWRGHVTFSLSVPACQVLAKCSEVLYYTHKICCWGFSMHMLWKSTWERFTASTRCRDESWSCVMWTLLNAGCRVSKHRWWGEGGIRAWGMRHKKRRKGGSQPSLWSIGRSFSVAALGRMVLPVSIISLPSTSSITQHNIAKECPIYENWRISIRFSIYNLTHHNVATECPTYYQSTYPDTLPQTYLRYHIDALMCC